MALAIRAVAENLAATGTSFNPSLPVGIQEGDLMVMQIATASTQSFTVAGWFRLQRLQNATNGHIYYGKYATASEAATASVTVGVSTTVVIAVVAIYSTTAQRIVFDYFRNASQTSASVNRTHSAVIPRRNDALILLMGTAAVSGDNVPPATYTELYDYDTTRRVYGWYKVLSGGANVSTGNLVGSGPSSTSRTATFAISEMDPATLPTADNPSDRFYGNPDYFLWWNNNHVARTLDFSAGTPVWQLLDTGWSGEVLTCHYVLVDSQTVGVWLLTTVGLYFCSDIRAETVTWVEKATQVEVRALCDGPPAPLPNNTVIMNAITDVPSIPGSLVVGIAFTDDQAGDFDLDGSGTDIYDHCYFYRTIDYGDTWTLIDATNLSHTYSGGSGNRNYCYMPIDGFAAFESTLWAVRMTQRRSLNYRVRALKSTDGGLTWSEPINGLEGGLTDQTDGTILGPIDSVNGVSYASSGAQGATERPSVQKSTDAWSTVVPVFELDSLSVYGGASGRWRQQRRWGDPNHVIALIYYGVDNVYHVFESSDAGVTWNFVHNTIGDDSTMQNGMGSPPEGCWYVTPTNWPVKPQAWAMVRARQRPTSTAEYYADILYTEDHFRTVVNKSGNLPDLFSWAATEDGGGGFFIPKPLIISNKYKVGLDYDQPLANLEDLVPQPSSPGIKVTRRTHGHGGVFQDEFLYAELQFNVLGNKTIYQAVLEQFDLIDNIEREITVMLRDKAYRWTRYNGIAVRPEFDEDVRWQIFPKNITVLIKELEKLDD